MSWLRANKRSAFIVGLTLLVPVLIYLYFLVGLLSLRQGYQADIDRLTPRIARLQGLMSVQDKLGEVSGAADRQLLGLVYPVTEDRAAVAARLQKDVRQILVDVGLTVTNSQVLPVREVEDFDYIGLKITLSGKIDGLDAALITLSAHTPMLLVESLEVWPNRQTRRKEEKNEQLLTASMQLLSLRAVQ